MNRFLCVLAGILLICGCNDNEPTVPPSADTTAPGSIPDLDVSGSAGGQISLHWTAPGDDGGTGRAAVYEIRRAAAPVTEANWPEGILLPSPPAPQEAGARQSYTVPPLPHSTWYFAIRAADEVPNWSGISNVDSITVSDAVPPSRVTDLYACSLEPGIIVLGWTAPGDDGQEGRADRYELRFYSEPISESTWDAARPVENVPEPAAGGAAESLTLNGMTDLDPWYFALKAVDPAGNRSALSNPVGVTLAVGRRRRLTFSLPGGNGARHPAWSPDGQSVAFSAEWSSTFDSEIYRVSAGCGAPENLTNEQSYDNHPAWSPDGTKVAFMSTRGGVNEIWVKNLQDASAPFKVSDNLTHCGEPAWSPDGGAIAFTVTITPDEVSQIYAVRLHKSGSGGGSPFLLTSGACRHEGPAWSPDGRMILYTSDESGTMQVWTMPAEGGVGLRRTSEPDSHWGQCWSPGGDLVLYTSGNVVWTRNLLGQNPALLAYMPGPVASVAWSPDGQRLAVETNAPGQDVPDVWIITLREP